MNTVPVGQLGLYGLTKSAATFADLSPSTRNMLAGAAIGGLGGLGAGAFYNATRKEKDRTSYLPWILGGAGLGAGGAYFSQQGPLDAAIPHVGPSGSPPSDALPAAAASPTRPQPAAAGLFPPAMPSAPPATSPAVPPTPPAPSQPAAATKPAPQPPRPSGKAEPAPPKEPKKPESPGADYVRKMHERADKFISESQAKQMAAVAKQFGVQPHPGERYEDFVQRVQKTVIQRADDAKIKAIADAYGIPAPAPGTMTFDRFRDIVTGLRHTGELYAKPNKSEGAGLSDIVAGLRRAGESYAPPTADVGKHLWYPGLGFGAAAYDRLKGMIDSLRHTGEPYTGPNAGESSRYYSF